MTNFAILTIPSLVGLGSMQPVIDNLYITVIPIFCHQDAERLDYFCLNHDIHYPQSGYIESKPVYFCTVDPIVVDDTNLVSMINKYRAIYALIFHTEDFIFEHLNNANLTTKSTIEFSKTASWFKQDILSIMQKKVVPDAGIDDRVIITAPEQLTMSHFDLNPYIISTPKGDIESNSIDLHNSYYVHIGTFNNQVLLSVLDAQKDVIYIENVIPTSTPKLLPFNIDKIKYLFIQSQLSTLINALTYSGHSCTVPMFLFSPESN